MKFVLVYLEGEKLLVESKGACMVESLLTISITLNVTDVCLPISAKNKFLQSN